MKAGVVHLVVVLVVLAWPCAAQDHQCSPAHTVVGAAEKKTVANLTRMTGGLLCTKIYLHPESAFEGVLLITNLSSITSVWWWIPAHTHCFTHNTDWWRVWIYCYMLHCYMNVGECQWSSRDIELPGKHIGGQVMAVGASRWRATEPTGNCTVAYPDLRTPYREESCSLANKHPTTDSPSTTTTPTTTTDSPSTTTTTTDIPSTNTTTTTPTDSPSTTTTTDSPSTTTTTDSPSTNTTTTTLTDNPSTTTTTTDSPSTATTTTTDSPSTTTTTDFSTTTITTNRLPMVLVVVVVVVVMVVVVAMVVMKIRHNRPGAPGLSSSSSLALLYKKNVDNVAEYC